MMRIKNAACFDVYYYGQSAKACKLVFQVAPEIIIAEECTTLAPVQPYIAGEFYLRELPCLLKLCRNIHHQAGLAIVDGYVWLGKGRKGLGAYFYEALGGKIPVIGVAKKHYYGCDVCQEVYRGRSKKPLYVTGIGLEPADSAHFVKHLGGNNRIPDVLKRVDRLTRER